MDYVAVRDFIVNDETLTFGKTDEDLEGILNDESIGGNTEPVTKIHGDKLVEVIDPDEFDALPTEKLSSLQVLLSLQTINISNSNVLLLIDKIFGNTSVSRTNIITLSTRPTTVAKKEFGQRLSLRDIHIARRKV